jgi:hypothetical protein
MLKLLKCIGYYSLAKIASSSVLLLPEEIFEQNEESLLFPLLKIFGI